MLAAPFEKSVVSPILIGRAKDVDVLARLITVAAQGNGQTALVAGEAGIGKSRLVAEIIQHAEKRGTKILRGNCFETDRALPYAPFSDILRDFYGMRPPADVPRELAAILPDPSSPPPTESLDREQAKRRLFIALAEFFRAQAPPSALIVLEDLHWCDDTSLEFILYLARRIARQPILLLLTYRYDEAPASLESFLAELDRARLATELRLNRLAQPETDAMLRAIFGLNRPVRSDFLNILYPLTEGNPFFIEEILKSLIVSGEIFYADGAWDRKPISELHIPRTVQDAVHRRAEKLSRGAQELLTFASVIGQRFDFSLLCDLTQQAEMDLLEQLKELIQNQLIVEESPDRFTFRHALTRQAVYAELLGHERITMHQKIGESLERTDAPSSELAHHFYRAGAWSKAREYSQRAGEQAQALYSPRAAVEHFTHALESAKRLGAPPSLELLRARGGAYETLGDFENARADFIAGLEAGKGRDDEWIALIDLGKLWTSRDYAKSGEYYKAALAHARASGDASKIAYSLNRIGNWHSNQDEPRHARDSHQEALTIFQRLEDRAGIAETSDLLAMANWIGGDFDKATIHYTEAIQLFRGIGDRQGLVSSLSTLALRSGRYKTETVVLPIRELSDANADGEEALKIAREIESRSGEAYALWCLSAALASQGECGRALSLTQESLAIAEEIQHQQWRTAAHCILGGIYLDLLALPEALNHLERALALAKEIGSLHWIRIASGQFAMALIAQKDLVKAEAILEQAIPLDAAMDSVGKRQCWLAKGELALAQGHTHLAMKIADELIESAASRPRLNPLPEERGSIIPRLWKLRGDTLAAQHSPEGELVLREGIEKATEQGALPLLWRLHLSLGKFRKREEEFDSARRMIHQIAASITDDTLRANFVTGANALIPSGRTPTARQTAKKDFGGLTVREREVAAMIAQGKSNREIAETLVVSERTIETHVGNMLTKLGFGSRAQIAVWATERKIVGG